MMKAMTLGAALTAPLLAALLAGAAPAMGQPPSALPTAVKAPPPPRMSEDEALIAAIKGPWRPKSDVARDVWRHPLESLTFWGLQPGTVVADLEPGGGYWTQILAPYLAKTGGRYIAGVADRANPALSEGGLKARAAFEARYADPSIYGAITFANFGPKSAPFAPPGSVDLVLTSRELHNWAAAGLIDKIMADAFAALKPGGVFAVEDHRADPGPESPELKSGYISTKRVVDAAVRAGFRLDAASEVNANPADIKNYPFGVWTLPPTRRSPPASAPLPNFDRARYDAIGESDRMTLRFRKPG